MKKTLILLLGTTLLAATPAMAYGKMHHNADQMFDKMDTNGDGYVSKDEFDDYKDKMFKEADANGDGKISRAEWMAFRKKEHARMHPAAHNTSDDNQPATSEDTKTNNPDANK